MPGKPLWLPFIALMLAALFAADATALDQSQASAGLKEALVTSTVDAVRLTGRPNGYFDNPAIKIGIPPKLKFLNTGLRTVGYGPQIDQFVLSMNRTAEAAAPKAEPIFKKAIMNMTFSDAQRIVSGGKHSATDYFKAKTSGELTTAFTPIVKSKMAQNSVTNQYDALMGKYQSGPMAMGGLLGGASENFDITGFVVHKSLDGLFFVVGQEEEKIRTNPAAQITPLLKQVFGGFH
jgi:hypothetical protein